MASERNTLPKPFENHLMKDKYKYETYDEDLGKYTTCMECDANSVV